MLATLRNAPGEEQREVDLFSRENPVWEEIGILVPSTKKGGQKAFTLRNARQTREAMLKTLEKVLTLNAQLDLQPAPEAVA